MTLDAFLHADRGDNFPHQHSLCALPSPLGFYNGIACGNRWD